MKKSLIALAALAFVGAAAAQSSVTLYGIADIYVAKAKVTTKNKLAAASGGVSGSRWGVKGSEDLGGGLKANFNFEQGVDLGTGTAAGFDRQANVGFSGGFGTIKLGNSGTALDDVFGATNTGFDSALSANKVWHATNAQYTGNAAAQLYYATPEIAGFSGAFSTQLVGNMTNKTSAEKTTAFNVTYAAGPIGAGIGYEDSASQKGTLFNASYDLGMAKLLGSYYTTKQDTTNTKTNSYQFGADVPLSSALTLSVGYANSKVKGAKADSAFSIAAAYGLSKRTTVYTGYRAESRSAANKALDNDTFAIGVKHTF